MGGRERSQRPRGVLMVGLGEIGTTAAIKCHWR